MSTYEISADIFEQELERLHVEQIQRSFSQVSFQSSDSRFCNMQSDADILKGEGIFNS